MGMLITTATNDVNTDGTHCWIFSPGDTDGEAQGLALSGGAMKIYDILEAMGLEPHDQDFSYGADFDIDPFLEKLEEAIEATDMDDDYLYPLLMKTKTVVINGQNLGACYVQIC